jgi:hypothetical protein
MEIAKSTNELKNDFSIYSSEKQLAHNPDVEELIKNTQMCILDDQTMIINNKNHLRMQSNKISNEFNQIGKNINRVPFDESVNKYENEFSDSLSNLSNQTSEFKTQIRNSKEMFKNLQTEISSNISLNDFNIQNNLHINNISKSEEMDFINSLDQKNDIDYKYIILFGFVPPKNTNTESTFINTNPQETVELNIPAVITNHQNLSNTSNSEQSNEQSNDKFGNIINGLENSNQSTSDAQEMKPILFGTV